MTPLIIDTDPGVDDAFALAVACLAPEVDLLAAMRAGASDFPGALPVVTAYSHTNVHLFQRDYMT